MQELYYIINSRFKGSIRADWKLGCLDARRETCVDSSRRMGERS